MKERLKGRQGFKVTLGNDDEVLVLEKATVRSVSALMEIMQFDLSNDVGPVERECILLIHVGRRLNVWTVGIQYSPEPSLQRAGKEIVRVSDLISRQAFSSIQQGHVVQKVLQTPVHGLRRLIEVQHGDFVAAGCEIQIAYLQVSIPIS